MYLEQLPYSLSFVAHIQASMVDGNARIWAGLLDRSGALPCSLPLWIRLIPDSWGEDVLRPHPQPSDHPNTSLLQQGLLGIQMATTAHCSCFSWKLHLALA